MDLLGDSTERRISIANIYSAIEHVAGSWFGTALNSGHLGPRPQLNYHIPLTLKTKMYLWTESGDAYPEEAIVIEGFMDLNEMPKHPRYLNLWRSLWCKFLLMFFFYPTYKSRKLTISMFNASLYSKSLQTPFTFMLLILNYYVCRYLYALCKEFLFK